MNTTAGARTEAERGTDVRLTDQAFARLYKAVIECELAPNSIVSEPQLEQGFGFGRVALRVAMDRLARMQLVRPLHRRGYEIAPITLRDVKNTFDIRLLLEPPVAREAVARIDIGLLKELNERCMRPAAPGNRVLQAELINSNREFHMVIARTSGNDKLVGLIEQVLRDTERVYYFGLIHHPRFAEMQSEHMVLIDALATKDGASAERIAREHIECGYRIVLDAILHSSTLADANIGRLGPATADRITSRIAAGDTTSTEAGNE